MNQSINDRSDKDVLEEMAMQMKQQQPTI